MKKTRFQELIDDVSVLRNCCHFVWSRRSTYIKYMIVGVIVALIVAFSIPNKYTSSVVLAPETQAGALDGLSGLASMAGLNMGNIGQDAYTVELYPTIVSSFDFSLALSNIKVKSSEINEELTYGEYLVKYRKQAWWMYPVEWISALYAMLRPADEPFTVADDKNSLRYVSKKEHNVGRMIQANVTCAVETLTGVISVTVTDNNPEVAATVADSVVNRLSNFILEYRTRKARADYEYLSAVCDSTKKTYLEVQAKYADYASKHLSITSPAHQARLNFLENEVSLAYSAYSTMVGQMQMAQAKILETTPVYTVIESAYVPLYASSPKKVLILMAFVMLAFFVSTAHLVYVEILRKKWNKGEA